MSETKVKEATTSLTRIQDFDTNLLPQTERFGKESGFQDAVEPAKRIISLFSQFPSQYIADLPDNLIDQLKSSADSFYNILNEIIKFDNKQMIHMRKELALYRT
jgi:hypothetical protein